MSWRWILPLGLSAVLAAVGLALRGSPAFQSAGVLLLGLGLSVGAIVAVLVLVAGLKRTRSPLSHPEARRIRTLAAELSQIAESIDRVGLLALADAQVSVCAELFRRGAAQTISAVEPLTLRSDLEHAAAAELDRLAGSTLRRVSLVRVASVLALGAALGLMLQSVLPVFAGAPPGFSDGQALAVLLLTYTGCTLIVLGHDLSRRAGLLVRERQLAAAMITEALLQFRSGSPRAVVRDAIARLINPDMPDDPPSLPVERAAA